MYFNIEKSAFRKGQYVGYAPSGVFRIWRAGNLWVGASVSGSSWAAKTLREWSEWLDSIK